MALGSTVRISVVAATLLLATTGNAQPYEDGTVYTGRQPAFLAAQGSIVTNDLNGLPDGTTVVPFGELGQGTLSGATIQSGMALGTTVLATTCCINGVPQISMTFSHPVNAVGFDFVFPSIPTEGGWIVAWYVNGHVLPDGRPLERPNGGTWGTVNPQRPDFVLTNFFVGLGGSSSFVINRVEIYASSPKEGPLPFRIDNLVVATAAPEPNTVALLATGLLAWGGAEAFRRRRGGARTGG